MVAVVTGSRPDVSVNPKYHDVLRRIGTNLSHGLVGRLHLLKGDEGTAGESDAGKQHTSVMTSADNKYFAVNPRWEMCLSQ